MNTQLIKILWYGHEVRWDGFDLHPDNADPYVIVCADDGHYIANNQLEIHYKGKLWWHSPDVWFAGMIKPY